MNLVLNDSTPTPAPTNGCCAGVADVGGALHPIKLEMQANGTAGSGTSTLTVNVGSSQTNLYYIGNPGDFNNTIIQSGNWTVPLHLSALSGTIILDSIYICRANSSGTSQGTIGSSTSMNTTLASGTQSFTVSGAQTTFNTGDVVVVSFQLHDTTSGSITVVHDQTITTPTAYAVNAWGYGYWTGTLGQVVNQKAIQLVKATSGKIYRTPLLRAPVVGAGPAPRPWCFRRDWRRPGAVFTEGPPRFSPPGPVAGKLLPPRVVTSSRPRAGVVFRTRLPSKPPPPPVAGGVLPPRIVRSDLRRPGKVYWVRPPLKQVQALAANHVAAPLVVRRDYRRGALVYGTRLLPVAPTARPGIYIELKSGPLGAIPILRQNEPAFTNDSYQLFVGDGFANHLQVSYVSPPVHSTSPGYPGQVSWDSTYFYVCTAVNTWLRVALTGGF